MGMETIMLAIIAGAFGVFMVGVMFVSSIAGAQAITFEEEQAKAKKPVPAPAPVRAAPEPMMYQQAA